MRTVLTRDGQVADEVALEAYGRTTGATEALMAANPVLAGLGAVLPEGVMLQLPDLPEPALQAVARLWD